MLSSKIYVLLDRLRWLHVVAAVTLARPARVLQEVRACVVYLLTEREAAGEGNFCLSVRY
jgi:hypothetical protein